MSSDPASAPSYPQGDGTTLKVRVETLLKDPLVVGAHWGIAVTSLEGVPLFGQDEGELFRPASTAKLFTTAVALAVLGPDATVKTSISFQTPTEDGTVRGDLALFGRGDANLSAGGLSAVGKPSFAGAEDMPAKGSQVRADADPLGVFDELAAAVATKGVRHVTGDLVANGGPWDPYPEGWAAEDLLWGYGAPVSGLSLNDNELVLKIVADGAPGIPATITLAPDLGLYHIDSTVVTVPAGTVPAGITVHHTPGDGAFRVTGSLAAGKRYTTELAIDDPPRFAGVALRRALLAHGITVDGAVRVPRIEPSAFSFLQEQRRPLPDTGMGEVFGEGFAPRPLAIEHTSPPLIEDVSATLKESLNLHAELMLRTLGTRLAFGSPYTAAVEGARVVHSRLLAAGLAENDFILYDGSGLSTKDLVTPRAEAQLLAYAAKQPWFPQWKAALPVGGVDGTLASRFTAATLKGHVFAKTGTLGESRALAGYLLCRSGREVIFAILDDDHQPGSSADRVVMDKIVEAIAASN